MSKPITVNIPHRLGRAEAQRRIAEGFANIGQSFGPQAAKALKTDWQGDRMDMLAMMAGSVKDRLQREGQLMLEKK